MDNQTYPELSDAPRENWAEPDRIVFQAVGRAFEDQTPEQIEREVDCAIREGRRRRRGPGSSSTK